LCWAEANAARRPGRATRDAADACEVFHSLGATPWAARAEGLLGVSGSASPRPAQQQRMTATLTSAELRVALAIGRGASSREAADELYVSVRTVEFHLGNIYRKLALRSRTELALLVDRERQVSSG
jgi:DNA-binding NarL/FixJ family response regulator